MRIELEDENKKKQQEEHTCQQLSQKHESDLTKKEKRLLEKEKLKVMDWKGKLQYIWMYYKVWIFSGNIGIVFLGFWNTKLDRKCQDQNFLIHCCGRFCRC